MRQSGELKMVNLNLKLKEMLESTRLHQVFDIYETETSALESFKPLVARAHA